MAPHHPNQDQHCCWSLANGIDYKPFLGKDLSCYREFLKP
jgi:hypothetical protein